MTGTNKSKTSLHCEYINCLGDVVELLSYDESRPYKLYKIEQHDTGTWVYMMFINNDVFPIVISEELAQNIIAKPSIGGDIAYNTWLERHQ